MRSIHASRDRGMRALIAGGLIALAVASLPAHAGTEPPPGLLSTSVDGGWSINNKILLAAYDSPLVGGASSTVTVTDKDLNPVGGTTTISSTYNLKFTAASAMLEKNGPYRVVFKAHAVGQDAGFADTVSAHSFRVDVNAPVAPTVAGASAVPAVLAPGDTFRIQGAASDPLVGDTPVKYASGVASVVFHFFNPAMSLKATDPTHSGSEVLSRSVSVTCGPVVCPASTTFDYRIATDALPQKGLWSVRVTTIDRAGNQSGPSDPISFIWTN